MNLPLFIARRIYSDQGDRRKVSRPAIRIATLGVAIGLAVMIITVSVVLGFKHTIRDKVVGFGSHIQVMNLLSMSSVETYPICIEDSLMQAMGDIEGISHVERYALARGILKTDEDFLGVVFKGIGPEYDLNYLSQHLVEGNMPTFSDSTSTNRILLSRIMADKLKLKAGDRIYAYFIDDGGVRTRRFTIAGIYQTNMTRFDELICYTDLYTACKLNGWFEGQCSGAELQVNDFDHLDDAYARIIDNVNRTQDRYNSTFSSQTIYDAYPQIFNWLELLDINVWIILGLMICLAGITMISGLLIIILERTSMIGVLKALGARNRTIRHTFLWFSAFIISQGLLIGDIIGIGLVVLQQHTGLVTLDPQTYYVSEAPMELNIPLVVGLNIATLLVSISVLIIPSFFISHIHPAKSMRYE
ncbi:MAG: ABC transporter permease [Prevotella sp.]|nr:ABC transporter permease [Prevotella sp.]